ncbi:MAG: GNAT family N-acetyltransferase [Ardenticatenaceae bacterium]|nr:GNAT family N-acetyltransferase [Ardenticatenaceae bacterium]
MEKQVMDYSFTTKDGQEISVRRLRHDDAVYLVDIFENMSSDSRYRRFHQMTDNLQPALIWREAENIAHLDEARQGGLIAFADLPDRPQAPIAAARFVCLGEGRAETAVSVRDDMQNKGIGTQLLHLLTEEARAQGIQKLVADIMNNNRAILGVLRKLPYVVSRVPDGLYSTLEIDLTRLKEEEGSGETAVSRC